MKCPSCGFEQADGLLECQKCQIIFSKWQVRTAPPPSLTKPTNEFHLEAWLLIFSFPIIIPSLIINFFGAKRWGRVDFWLIAFDGLVLTALCFRSPILLLLVLIAWAASMLLWILRREKLTYGIFLGYSDKVAQRLIWGGVLIVIGLFFFYPTLKLCQKIEKVIHFEKQVSVNALKEFYIKPPKRVVVQDAMLDWDKKTFCVVSPKGTYFYAEDPRIPTVITDPNELWLKRAEMVGRFVTLENVPVSVGGTEIYERKDVELSRVAEGAKEKDKATRLFSLVENTEGRVWLVSEPVSSQYDETAKNFLSRTTHSGTVFYVYTDASLGQQYWARRRQPLPYMCITIFPDKKQNIQNIQTVETWVPVKGTDERLWVVFPKGVADKPEKVQGIYLGPTDLSKGLVQHIIERFQKQGWWGAEPQVIVGMGVIEYLDWQGLISQLEDKLRWNVFWFFFLGGYSLIGMAVRIAQRE